MATSDWDPKGIDVFFKSDYTFDDAQALANMWDIGVVEAKQALGHKIIHDIQHLLPKGLRQPTPSEGSDISPNWDPKGHDAFFNSDYTFDDAQALANMWDIGVVEAKQAIGHKIINNIQKLLPSGLQQPTSKTGDSPDANFQAWVKSEYDYDDAVLLASLWSLGVPEAKNEIGYRVLNGTDKTLPNKLRENNPPSKPVDPDAKFYEAYRKSDYDFDDAALLADLWSISIVEAKHTIGAKVINKITHLLPAKINGGS